MEKGIFITFEGPEGSGKTTHAKLLIDIFKNKNFNVVYTREPGGTKISEEIRDILLNKENSEMDAYTELFLYLASRRQHIIEVIKKALINKSIVICDRFIDASIAYQGFGRGIDIKFIENLNLIATDNIIPDLTFIMDIEVSEGLEKTKKIEKKNSKSGEVDRIESEGLEFHKRVREGYKTLVKLYPDRVYEIDVQKEIGEVHENIVKIIRSKFNIIEF